MRPCPSTCREESWRDILALKGQIAVLLEELRTLMAEPTPDCTRMLDVFRRLKQHAATGEAVASRCSK
jgi:hypothetical protein